MRLFDLVEEDNGVWLTTDSFRQLTTFIVTDISRRCTDQTSRTKFFLIFAHIDTRHHIFIVKQIFSQRFGQFCLTDTCRTEEDKGTNRTFRVLQSGTATTYGIGYRTDCLILTDHTGMQFVFQTKQFVPFALQHLINRDTCPTGYYIGNIFAVDFLLDHGSSTLHRMQFGLYFLDLFFFGFYFAVTDFGHFTVVAFAFSFVGFEFQVLDVYLVLLNLVDQFFFAFPLSFLFSLFFFEIGDLLVQLLQLAFVVLTFDRFAFDFQLFDTTGYFVQ